MNHSPVAPQCGKVRHPSRKIAMQTLRKLTRAFDSIGRDRGAFHVYPCPNCGGFHLGNSDEELQTEYQRKRHNRRPRHDDYN